MGLAGEGEEWKRMGALVGLAEEVGPVGEAAGHQAGVDEVEFVLVEPGIFGVVDDEFEVWGDAGGC